MCAEAGVETEASERRRWYCALLGAETSNLAPPVIQDGDLVLSCPRPFLVIHISEKSLDFTKTLPVPALAIQEHVGSGGFAFGNGQQGDCAKGRGRQQCRSPSGLPYGGSVQKRHLQAIERNVASKVPFTLETNQPTVRRFCHTCSYLDMCEGKWLTPLESKTEGDTIAKYAPKLRKIVTHMRSLPSSAKNDPSRIANTNLVPPMYSMCSGKIAWRCGKTTLKTRGFSFGDQEDAQRRRL